MATVSARAAIAAALAAAVLVLIGPATAGGVIPPRDCKIIEVSGKRYQVKADQLRCSTARRYAGAYLRSSRDVPRGYRCSRFRSGLLAFVCRNTSATPDREFRAIRRR